MDSFEEVTSEPSFWNLGKKVAIVKYMDHNLSPLSSLKMNAETFQLVCPLGIKLCFLFGICQNLHIHC